MVGQGKLIISFIFTVRVHNKPDLLIFRNLKFIFKHASYTPIP